MRFHRRVDFSGFSVEVPPLVVALDPEQEDTDEAFCDHIARYVEWHLGDAVPTGVSVSGHPARDNGAVRTTRQDDRLGTFLGSFSVSEGQPPFLDYVRLRKGWPLTAALAVGGLFVWTGCTGRSAMELSLVSIGQVLGSMALVAVGVLLFSLIAQYAAWREWEPSEDLSDY
ncbi:hypothetical protein [Nocardiopsis halophila]|uniref:hypothetical protein n=1 Tax=Nocardiopsis halophila TaxID=141692 RepID=UPI00034ADEFD|nr:hypothetical protein [Nocardiopsis halophila]